METRRAHLRTKHGYEFLVKFYNAVDRSHFGCSNWEALCKAYVFQEGMRIRFDIRPEDYDDDDDINIWVDVCWKYALEAIIKWLLLYFHVHDNCLLFML